MAHLDFDASTVEPSQPFEVIPAGKYIFQVVNSEMRPTKSGDGQYLWLEMAVLEGEFANRRLFVVDTERCLVEALAKHLPNGASVISAS